MKIFCMRIYSNNNNWLSYTLCLHYYGLEQIIDNIVLTVRCGSECAALGVGLTGSHIHRL